MRRSFLISRDAIKMSYRSWCRTTIRSRFELRTLAKTAKLKDNWEEILTIWKEGFVSHNKNHSIWEKKEISSKLIKMNSWLEMPKMLKKRGITGESYKLRMISLSSRLNALRMIWVKFNWNVKGNLKKSRVLWAKKLHYWLFWKKKRLWSIL